MRNNTDMTHEAYQEAGYTPNSICAKIVQRQLREQDSKNYSKELLEADEIIRNNVLGAGLNSMFSIEEIEDV